MRIAVNQSRQSSLFRKGGRIVKRIDLILGTWLTVVLLAFTSNVMAQQASYVDGRYFPLSQATPPGVAAEWASKVGRANPPYFQPVRVSLPSTGTVTFYEGSPNAAHPMSAPAQAGLLVGKMYRLRVSDLPELPGAEFFPSIELIDRLHPPHGKAEEFPVEFELTEEELLWAANGQLVTKVVYLEQPNRVPVTLLDKKSERITTIEPYKNVIAEADMLGRPVAIVRLGGRTPDANQPDPSFFGPGGPIQIQQRPLESVRRDRAGGSQSAGVVRLNPKTSRRLAAN